MWGLLALFLCVSYAVECNPNNDCKTLRQCDRNMLECWTATATKPTQEKPEAQCKCFWTYYKCAQIVGALYLPQVKEWCNDFNGTSLCPEVCTRSDRISDKVPTEMQFAIFNRGTQLSPDCDGRSTFDRTVPLGVCQENDEYGVFRVDVVDGFVSRGSDNKEKVPGLKLQWQFGCTKDENGECKDCGHMDETWPDMCTWGCQEKSPEKACYSFWGSGWDKDEKPYKGGVALNVSVTTNKPCDDDSVSEFVDRVVTEATREASLNAQTELKQWKCSDIPPSNKRQQPAPTDPQITDVWVEILFTGSEPRVGAANVQALFSGGDNQLIVYGTYSGVVVVSKSTEINIYQDPGSSGLSGAAVFGIIVLVLVILVIIGVAAVFLLGKKSVENV